MGTRGEGEPREPRAACAGEPQARGAVVEGPDILTSGSGIETRGRPRAGCAHSNDGGLDNRLIVSNNSVISYLAAPRSKCTVITKNKHS